MWPDTRYAIVRTATTEGWERPVEMCEHKGVGHPDSLCDGVAEAVSRALCRAYLHAYGTVAHYNVDKALLVGGESAPRFGGGTLRVPMRLIVCGRAAILPGIDLAEFVCAAAREYLDLVLHDGRDHFTIESVVRPGSPNLTQVVGGSNAEPRANDTSFGAGFAPFSRLEELVLQAAQILRSTAFRQRFPVAGDDYKVMGARSGAEIDLTVALALVDREISSVAHYFTIKSAIVEYLRQALDTDAAIVLNALDDSGAVDESGVYLTVTGLSAEHGDDGQVGRGNRVCGLITPQRTMSLEAAAGKNAVAHVGKIYNVLALQVARAIVHAEPTIVEASVQLLSTIGRPVSQPALVAIDLRIREPADVGCERRVRDLVEAELRQVGELSARLIRGELAVF
ncbi:methionine adenosyltransferase [Tahibacter amnicola]|uniref:Methionine adenosyltransferase n=1 Tax=Tahibacter amnicola TaxID=2976241 RepID=A0ABY6B944_9GAMM|nr:methionine adenosyltransferase [Tahibacter amnicola]UXI66061.1 methionine adenosyltransferase [Tahibacter amnicola]